MTHQRLRTLFLMLRSSVRAVHYTAWTAAAGEEVDTTRDAREPAQIIVAKGAHTRSATP